METPLYNDRLSVAPMMDRTDRHCRVFHRLMAPRAMLYTEMVTADAILHGHRDQLLGKDDEYGGGTVLQIGGSDPARVGQAVAIADDFGYAGYNLNVGCPSGRVQSGKFGACLMAEPELVARIVAAMMAASGTRPVSVKCRIGIDDMPPEGLDYFVRCVAEAGVRHFIIHARIAVLGGLSPKENRTIPPLDYDRVRRLRDDNPELRITINGGIEDVETVRNLGREFHGVMVGRTAYQKPHELGLMDAALNGGDAVDRFTVLPAMAEYAAREMEKGTPLIAITRHMLGLMAGLPGARQWRRRLSEEARVANADARLILAAGDEVMAAIDSRKLAA